MPRDIHYYTKNWVHKNGTITIFFGVITLRAPLNCDHPDKIYNDLDIEDRDAGAIKVHVAVLIPVLSLSLGDLQSTTGRRR